MKTVCDHVLDLKGAVSPLTLLRVIQVFKEIRANETLEVLGSDPETRANIFKVLPPGSYSLISQEDSVGDTQFFRIRVRKKRGGTICGAAHSTVNRSGCPGCESSQQEALPGGNIASPIEEP